MTDVPVWAKVTSDETRISTVQLYASADPVQTWCMMHDVCMPDEHGEEHVVDVMLHMWMLLRQTLRTCSALQHRKDPSDRDL